jgi:glycosyltransferase involved in cell wall biosynthesis
VNWRRRNEKMDLPLISVIIPVYNVEKYLARCVDSIIKQTYSKLDVILVDDGSTDRSGNICEEYKEKDSRIRVIHKANGGLSDARNVGIDIAEGQYITFIDSDDYIAADYVEYLFELLTKYKADISICSKLSFNDGETIEQNKYKTEIREYTGFSAMEDLFYQKNIENSAWGKLYKTFLFKDIYYPVGKLYEDLGTTYKVLFKAQKVVWSSEKKYFYRQRVGSIMKKTFSVNNMDRVDMSRELLEFVDEECKSLLKAAISRFFISNVQVLRELPLHECKYADIANQIEKNIKKYRKNVLFDKNAKKINRLIALFSYTSIIGMQKLGGLHKIVYK